MLVWPAALPSLLPAERKGNLNSGVWSLLLLVVRPPLSSRLDHERSGWPVKYSASAVAVASRVVFSLLFSTAVPQVSVVSCLNGFGLPELIDRVAAQGATSISVPPAWGLALRFIDALRGGEEPLQAAREHLGLASSQSIRFGNGNEYRPARCCWVGLPIPT